MKKRSVLWVYGLFLVIGLSSCHRNRKISISVSESGSVCRMYARFPVYKTPAVQRLLGERLDDDERSFRNTRINGTITLDDRTRFYLKIRPGELKIKIDETENSEASYIKVRDAFEDIKELLADNRDNW